ncbi:MAG: hypothetical protein D6732_11085 [Methanobacteriota archaeon]|nr:MAG: hypothetical protein D6732_11085 [Euryarchaeota archaeon]
MEKSFLCRFALLVLALGISGCSSHAAEMYIPGIDVDTDKVNTHFVVYEDPIVASTNSHKNNEILSITAKNLTDKTIVFSPGYIHIFAKSGSSWVPIENTMIYYPPDADQILPPAKEYPPGLDDSIVPYFPEMKKPTRIRVYLVGQIEDTGEKVGAYMDLTLQP